MPLINTQILNLKPKEKPYKVADFDGLYVTVTPTGSKLWHMKYRIDGREKRLSFGIYRDAFSCHHKSCFTQRGIPLCGR